MDILGHTFIDDLWVILDSFIGCCVRLGVMFICETDEDNVASVTLHLLLGVTFPQAQARVISPASCDWSFFAKNLDFLFGFMTLLFLLNVLIELLKS